MRIVEFKPGYFEPAWSTLELSELLGVAPSTIRYWVYRRWLEPSMREGDDYYFAWSAIEDFLNTHRDKVRKQLPKSLREILEEEIWPENLSRGIKLKRLQKKFSKEYDWFLFRAWVKMGLGSASRLEQMGDEEIAEKTGEPLPETWQEMRRELPEELNELRAKIIEELKRKEEWEIRRRQMQKLWSP